MRRNVHEYEVATYPDVASAVDLECVSALIKAHDGCDVTRKEKVTYPDVFSIDVGCESILLSLEKNEER